jgi:molybdopterin-guanine dinucleotide biosynthesis protein A
MRTGHLLALAIDMPFMTEDFLRYICNQIEARIGAVPKIDNRAEPLAAIYPREAILDFRNALAGTDFSLQTLTRSLVDAGKLRKLAVKEQQKKLFLNVNEISDLAL